MSAPIPALDPTHFTREQLAIIATEVARLLASWQASNTVMLDAVSAAMAGIVAAEVADPQARAEAVGDALADVLLTWSETLQASREATFGTLDRRFGRPTFPLQ